MWPSCEWKSGRLRRILAVDAVQCRLVLRHRFGGAIGGQQCVCEAKPVVDGCRHFEGVLRGAQFTRRIQHLFHAADQRVSVACVAHFRQPDHQCVHEASQPRKRKQDHEPVAILPAAHRMHGKEHRDDHMQAKAHDRHVGFPRSDARGDGCVRVRGVYRRARCFAAGVWPMDVARS